MVKLLRNDTLPAECESAQRKRHVLLGKPVCQNAFRRLIQIGSSRYTRLRKCAVRGTSPPIDGRTTRKGLPDPTNKRSVAKRQLVIGFLQNLLDTLSEPMPEASQSQRNLRDKAMAAESESKVVVPIQGNFLTSLVRFRRHRGRRPRLAGQLHRGKDQSQMRLLPPGSYSDYLMMLRAQYPDEKFSFKLFSRVSCQVCLNNGGSEPVLIHLFCGASHVLSSTVMPNVLFETVVIALLFGN